VLAEIHEVQNILLEAGAPEPHAGVQKAGPDAGIQADRMGDLLDVGLGFFAQGGNGINRGDTLRQKSVGHQLGKLAGP